MDEAARRVLRVKFALGLFDHPYVDETRPPYTPTPEKRALARKAAEESLVLLKNDANPIPFAAGQRAADPQEHGDHRADRAARRFAGRHAWLVVRCGRSHQRDHPAHLAAGALRPGEDQAPLRERHRNSHRQRRRFRGRPRRGAQGRCGHPRARRISAEDDRRVVLAHAARPPRQPGAISCRAITKSASRLCSCSSMAARSRSVGSRKRPRDS